jgi:tripartite-type tricarboxylate transporter receptor subunit TctC
MALSACASFALVPGAAQTQQRDTRPIRIVVIVAPGGSADLVARLLAEKLTSVSGRTYIVDNKPGAGGNLATEFVAQAPADGNTLLITTNNHTINPAIYAKVGYDPLKDFAPVMLIGRGPSVIAVHPSVKANTLQELLALARSKPGSLSYGSGGIGNPGNIQGELLKSLAHIDMVHVAYRGAGPAMADAVAGQIPVVFGSVASALPFMKAGKLRVLGVTSAKRTQLAPELPTIAEAGVPGYEYDLWWGILAPQKTPAAIVQQQNADLAKVMAMPEVREKLLANGIEPVGGSTSDFEQMLKADVEASYRLAKSANIKAE